MSMSNVLNCSSGSASSAVLRLGTRWGLKCSFLVTVLFTQMESTIESGYSAMDAQRHSIWSVSPLNNLKNSNGPSCVPLMPAGNSLDLKQVTTSKWVVKQVIFPIAVAKEKVCKKHVKRSKDGRVIAPRQAASSGKGVQEQKWTEEDMNKVFDLWEGNDHLLPGQKKLSKRAISKQTGVPYTTVCKRDSGRWGGGQRGKIAGGKRLSKVLDKGKQAGNFKLGGSGSGYLLADQLVTFN